MLNFSENAHVSDKGIVRDHGINLNETSSHDRMNKQGQGPTEDNCITVSQSFNKKKKKLKKREKYLGIATFNARSILHFTETSRFKQRHA